MCNAVMANETDPFTSLVGWYNVARENLNGDECSDWSYNSFVAINSNVEWNQPGTQSGSKD